MNPQAGERAEGIEASFGLFVAGSESAKALEFAEARLNTITLFVEIFVVLALYLAVSFWWDDGFGSHDLDVLYDGVSVVALVGKYCLDLVLAQ